MRRIRLILSMGLAVALMMVVAAPSAMADDWDGDCWDDWTWFWVCGDDDFFFDDGGFDLELGDVESGDIEQDTTVTSSGANANQAVSVLNAANTGNVQNVQGVLQVGSEADDIEFDNGGSIEVSPSLGSSADQTIRQSAVSFR